MPSRAPRRTTREVSIPCRRGSPTHALAIAFDGAMGHRPNRRSGPAPWPRSPAAAEPRLQQRAMEEASPPPGTSPQHDLSEGHEPRHSRLLFSTLFTGYTGRPPADTAGRSVPPSS